MKTIYLAGGCFWGVQRAFQLLYGVIHTSCGYVNGDIEDPTYQRVCKGDTGFYECVKIDYDENLVSLNTILDVFFMIIHPEQYHQQGNDIGQQYQSGVYVVDKDSYQITEAYFSKIKDQYEKFYTELGYLKNFYDAEDYHQDYLIKNPTGYCHVPLTVFETIKKMNH